MDTELLPLVTTRPEPAKRGTMFAIVEIDCAYTNNQMIPSGHLLPQGVSRVRIEERDIPKVEAMVEPHPEWIAHAEDAHRNQVEHEVAKAVNGLAAHERPVVEASVRERFAGSPSGEFSRAHKRDILPFRSVKVLQRGLLADQDEEQAQTEEALTKRLAAAMSGNAAMPANLQTLIDQAVEAKVAKALDAERAKQNPNSANNQQKR